MLHKRGELRRNSTSYRTWNSRPRYSIFGEERVAETCRRKKRGFSRVAAIEVPKGSDWNAGHLSGRNDATFGAGARRLREAKKGVR